MNESVSKSIRTVQSAQNGPPRTPSNLSRTTLEQSLEPLERPRTPSNSPSNPSNALEHSSNALELYAHMKDKRTDKYGATHKESIKNIQICSKMQRYEQNKRNVAKYNQKCKDMSKTKEMLPNIKEIIKLKQQKQKKEATQAKQPKTTTTQRKSNQK